MAFVLLSIAALAGAVVIALIGYYSGMERGYAEGWDEAQALRQRR